MVADQILEGAPGTLRAGIVADTIDAKVAETIADRTRQDAGVAGSVARGSLELVGGAGIACEAVPRKAGVARAAESRVQVGTDSI